MSSPSKRTDLPSSSLEGMERPVRSFKSFIRTVPPHLTSKQKKPLPPTPPPQKKNRFPLSPSSSQPDFRQRNPSVGSWKAPAEWFNSTTPPRRASDSSIIPQARTYSPMIPEPSPDILDMQIEPLSWQLTSGLSQHDRLQPIDERLSEKSDLSKIPPLEGPLTSPSQQPVAVKDNPNEHVAPLDLQDFENDPPDNEGESVTNTVPVVCLQTASTPDPAPISSTPVRSTMEKAFASLGLDSHHQEIAVQQSKHSNHGPLQHSEEINRQHIRGRKLFDTTRGDLLDDDTWEDVDMDDRTRKLSFSQDYHNLLAIQYHEMNTKPESIRNDSLDAQKSKQSEPVPLSDHESVPQELIGDEDLEDSLSRSSSLERRAVDPTRKVKHKHRIISWVPQRLGHNSKQVTPKHEPGHPFPSDFDSMQQMKIPESGVDKDHKHDRSFSKLLHTNKPLKFGKKNSKEDKTSLIDPSQGSSSPTQEAAPVSHLLPDKAPLRHLEATSRHESSLSTGQSYFSSYSEPQISASNPSELCSSVHSHRAQSPVVQTMATQNKARASDIPSYAHQSAQEILGSSPPPPRPKRPVFSKSPPLSKETWKSAGNTNDEESHKPKLLDKVREARRRHNKESRQERLKKSIKVVGPVDPNVVAESIR